VRPERVKSDVVASITGYSIRQVQELAGAGKIPSAAKLGAEWTFDPARVRKWVRLKEREIECRITTTSTNVREFGTRASKSKVATNELAYERVLKLKRAGSSARS